MPLNGLGGLGNLLGLSRSGGSQPASKRQKRTDVLESLGGLDKPRGAKVSGLAAQAPNQHLLPWAVSQAQMLTRKP